MSLPRFGLGYRSAYAVDTVLAARPAIDFLEIITENYLDGSRQSMGRLAALRAEYPVAMHGVGLSIAGPDPVPPAYLAKMRALKDWLEPVLVTDHLCWTSFGGNHSHDLLPTGLTKANLRRVAERVTMVQEALGSQILLENPSVYVQAAHDEMGEAEFLAALARKTGCGVLLDVNNLVVNHHNAGLDPIAYMEALPPGVVRQFHIAGHSAKPHIRIDTHNRPMCDEGWLLYRLARSRFPEAATLLEWDSDWPEFPELLAELDKARSMSVGPEAKGDALAYWRERAGSAKTEAKPAAARDETAYYPAFWRGITGEPEDVAAIAASGWLRSDRPVPAHVGMGVYHEAYLIRAHECLRDAFPTILHVLGEDCFETLARLYVKRHPHAEFSMNHVGAHLETYLRENPDEFDFGVSPALMGDLAHFAWHQHALYVAAENPEPALEATAFHGIPDDAWATLTISFVRNAHVAMAAWDVLPIWAAVKEGTNPARPAEEPTAYRMWAGSDSVYHKPISEAEYLAWRIMGEGETFGETAATLASRLGMDEEEAVITLVQALAAWFADGLVASFAS